MKRNQTNNMPKMGKAPHDGFRGCAIASMVIGISVVVVMLAMLLMEYAYAWTMMGGPYFPIWLYLSVLCFTFAGFISGIIGLKSSRRGTAIAGIILCSLVFIPYIYVLYEICIQSL
jgi:hypothetical protein